MPTSLVRNVANIQYGGLYLPVFSLMYLREKLELPYQMNLLGVHFQIDAGSWQFVFIITFLGAVINHGMARSIYGPGGPMKNPKDQWTVQYQKMTLTFSSNGGRRPAEWSDIEEKIKQKVEHFESIVSEFRKSLLEKCLISWYVVKTTFRAIAISLIRPFYTLVSLVTIWLLYTVLISKTGNFIGTGLFIAQTLFFLGGVVFKRFPTVVPPDSAPWLYVPEYKKSQNLLNDEEIEFNYDPRGLINSINDEYPYIAKQPDEQQKMSDDVDYLVELEDSQKES